MDDFSEIYEKQVRGVYRFLLKLTGDAQTAEELTQQTFYKAFLHIGQFKGKCSLYTWLCTIGKNEWLLECRKHKVFPLDLLKEAHSGPGPEEALLSRDRQTAVRNAVRKLPEPYREVVVLRVYGELGKGNFFSGKRKTERKFGGKNLKEEHLQTTHWCNTADRPAICEGKSMISCNVYRDLILLYVSGECGDDTKELVKAHLSQCVDCRAYYEDLTKPLTGEQVKSPAAPAGPPPSAPSDDSTEFDIARKVTKGLKKKWIISLTAGVAAILLAIGLCFLTVNQIRGDGLCFTNMDDRYYAKKFFQAIQKKDYEKAFSLIDVAKMYSEIRENGPEQTAKAVQDYEKAVIGETEVYLSKEAFLNDYQTYMENRDEAAFWSRMMIYNMEHRAPVDIPENIFQEAVAKLAVTDSGQEASSEASPESPASGYTLTTLESGERLYTLKGYGGADQLTLDEPCILAASYENALAQIQETQRVMTACAQYYEDMGYEKYKELVWEDFLGRMQKLEASGIELKQISVRNSYRHQDSDGRERWQVEITVRTSGEGSGDVIVMTSGSALRVGGGVGLEGTVDTLAELTRASADPSGFYARAYE